MTPETWSGEPYPATQTKVSYEVMTKFKPGSMTGPSLLTDDDGKPLPPYDLGDLGAHPFMSGYRTPEAAAETLARAREYVGTRGIAWLVKVTETITRELAEE